MIEFGDNRNWRSQNSKGISPSAEVGRYSRRQFLGSDGGHSRGRWICGFAPAAGNGRLDRTIVVGGIRGSTPPRCPKRHTPVLPGIFADMQYAGLDGIELMPEVLRQGGNVPQVGELSQKHHLPISALRFPQRKEPCATTNTAEISGKRRSGNSAAGQVGRANPGHFGRSGQGKKTPEQFDAQADVLRKIIAIGQANGVVLNLHNHTYEIADDLYDLKGTLARIPDVKLGPDIGG